MCIACLNGGFHQSTETDTNPLNLGTLTEHVLETKVEEPPKPWDKDCSKSLTDPLVNGLVSETWGPWMKENWGFLDDNKVDFYVDLSIPKQQRRFARRMIRKIDRVTNTKMQMQHDINLADVIVDDVDNYDKFGDEFSNANGLAYSEGDKMYATWLTNWNEIKITRKGKQRVSNYNRRLITHEILHTLGISHPFEDGANPNYTNRDTAMSYNFLAWGIKNPLMSADVAALQEIWGGVC